MIAVINFIAALIFQNMSAFQKYYTKNDEPLATFKKITFLQFFNIAIVSLMINFTLDVKLLNKLRVLNGEHDDFTVEWYRQIGATLGMTLLINTVSPHLPKLATALKVLTHRCYDRGCRLRRIDPANQELRTKQVLQQDLENLYTGEEINASYVYAQFFTTIWCILAYSSGMPILYPVASVNFFIIYWVYKLLLIKYYRKTVSFNQDLP